MTREMWLLPSTGRTSPGLSDFRKAAGSLGVKGSYPCTGFSRCRAIARAILSSTRPTARFPNLGSLINRGMGDFEVAPRPGHHVIDSPSCYFIHGAHGNVFIAKVSEML